MLGDLRTCCGMGLQRGIEPRLKAPQALVLAVTPQQPRILKQLGNELKGFRGHDTKPLAQATYLPDSVILYRFSLPRFSLVI